MTGGPDESTQRRPFFQLGGDNAPFGNRPGCCFPGSPELLERFDAEKRGQCTQQNNGKEVVRHFCVNRPVCEC